jgi:hypothetical protein
MGVWLAQQQANLAFWSLAAPFVASSSNTTGRADVVTFDTKSGADDEVRLKQIAEQVVTTKYDLARWAYTDRIVIESDAIPHSHPVLTLGTKFTVRSLAGFVSTYLHEQLHWFVSDHPGTLDALADLRELYPEVPDRDGGGATDEPSTYLHLIVNWLELAALRVAAPDEVDEVVEGLLASPVYPWIYREVVENGGAIEPILRRHGLTAAVD